MGQLELFYSFGDRRIDADNKYSRSIRIPQYVPSEVAPNIGELINTSKYTELLRNINKSDVPEDVKNFLRLGATRHIVFNYSKIADYYAHADKEIQELMEQSALVIIDVDDAIANGYLKLSNRMRELIAEQQRLEVSDEQ